jgi:hypothetical protein
MSRGLGIAERAVAACIARCKRRDAQKDAVYICAGEEPPPTVVNVTPWGVCIQLNPSSPSRPTESQLKAAKRAMHSFVRKFPEYGLMISKGGRGHLCLYERGDRLSAMRAKLTSQSGSHVSLPEASKALAHVEARRNEPFRLKEKRPIHYFQNKDGSLTPTHRRAPRVFRDLDLPD